MSIHLNVFHGEMEHEEELEEHIAGVLQDAVYALDNVRRIAEDKMQQDPYLTMRAREILINHAHEIAKGGAIHFLAR